MVHVPLGPNFPSAPISVWTKGTFSTGANSTKTGWIWAEPRAMIMSDALSVAFTDSSAAIGSFQFTGSGVTTPASNSPYTSASFSAPAASAGSLSYRLVAAGIRVRYVGTQLDMGGSLFGLSEPDHLSLLSCDTTDLRGYQQVHTADVSRKWHQVVWTPAAPDELEYSQDALELDSTHGPIGILVAAPSTTSLLYEFEVYAHFELIGKTARAKVSHSSDPVGGAAAWSAINAMRETSNSTLSAAAAMKATAEDVAQSASHVVSAMGTAAATMSGLRAAYRYFRGGDVHDLTEL